MAAEINAKYRSTIFQRRSRSMRTGMSLFGCIEPGLQYQIDDFVTAGTTGLDFNGDGVTEVTGSVNKTAAIAGGQIIVDAPDSFLISSDDTENTILVGTRASLEVAGATRSRPITRTYVRRQQ